MSTEPAPSEPFATVAAVCGAYNAIAPDYDADLAARRWVRRVLWSHMDRRFCAGDRVIDVGCGTGLDTVHLASRGVHVTAIDASAGMMRELRAQVELLGLASRVDMHVGDAVSVLAGLGRYADGIVSSFAAMNTIDLGAFAAAAGSVLAPGGTCTMHLLAPAYGRGRAMRLLSTLLGVGGGRRHDVSIRGHRLAHRLAHRREIYEAHFRAGFSLAVHRRLDAAMALTSGGRFFVLDLQRRHAGRV